VYCAQLLHTILHRTDLIIFPLTLQTITIAPTTSNWGKGGAVQSCTGHDTCTGQQCILSVMSCVACRAHYLPEWRWQTQSRGRQEPSSWWLTASESATPSTITTLIDYSLLSAWTKSQHSPSTCIINVTDELSSASLTHSTASTFTGISLSLQPDQTYYTVVCRSWCSFLLMTSGQK